MFQKLNQQGLWIGSLIMAGIGALLFHYLYGFALLDPLNHHWLMLGDSSVFYYGFNYFLREPWHFPLGLIHGYSAPEGTSIVYTDSIPWLALLGKVFGSGYASSGFQYFGAWILACFMLQGGVSFVWIYRQDRDFLRALLASCFFLTLPAFLARGFETTKHYSLLAHFLLMFALMLVHSRHARRFLGWSVLLFLALGIHFYFLLMIGVLFIASEFPRLQFNPTLVQRKHIGLLLALAVVAYVLGYFAIPVANTTAGGFGLYSMNVNAFLNGAGLTRLPDLGFSNPLEYEGYCYLGLGLLVLFGIYLRTKKLQSLTPSLELSFVFLTFLALSFKLSISIHVIPEVIVIPLYIAVLMILLKRSNANPMQNAVSSVVFILLIFVFGKIARATGRFIWPVEYFLIYAVFSLRPPKKVILALLLLQLWDVSPLIGKVHDQTVRLDSFVYPVFDVPGSLPLGIRHVSIQDPSHLDMMPIVKYAFEHGLDVGPLIVARGSSSFRKNEQETLARQLAALHPSPDTLYVIGDLQLWDQIESACGMNPAVCNTLEMHATQENVHYLYVK